MEEEKTRLEKRLDEHLERALSMRPFSKDKLMPNLLLVGSFGTGKSYITSKWAKRNGINLVDIGIEGWEGSLREWVFTSIIRPNTVLNFYRFDNSDKKTRALFSDLMERHVLQTSLGEMFLPEILFSIATVWPPEDESSDSGEPLTEEEEQKFERYNVNCYKDEFLRYVNDYYAAKIESAKKEGDGEYALRLQRSAAMTNHIVKDPRFQFQSDAGDPTYNGFFRLMRFSGGEKKKVLKYWNFCHAPNLKPVIEEILSDYSDDTEE